VGVGKTRGLTATNWRGLWARPKRPRGADALYRPLVNSCSSSSDRVDCARCTRPQPEVAMNLPEPDDVVEQLFAEFMADQKARLSPERYLQSAEIIDLFDLYLDRYYRPECSRREHDAPARSDGRFCGLSPAVDLVRRFSVFLGDFLPREIAISPAKLRAARAVIKALGAWLTAKGYVVRNNPARKRANKSKRPPYLPGFFQD
jgi:hypothetical protein